MTEYYNQGWDAAYADRDVRSNPYRFEDIAGWDWVAGYTDATNERIKNGEIDAQR